MQSDGKHIRCDRRAQAVNEVQAAGGDTQAFLDELDARRQQLNDLVCHYIQERNYEYSRFESQLSDKYKANAVSVLHTPATLPATSHYDYAQVTPYTQPAPPVIHGSNSNSNSNGNGLVDTEPDLALAHHFSLSSSAPTSLLTTAAAVAAPPAATVAPIPELPEPASSPRSQSEPRASKDRPRAVSLTQDETSPSKRLAPALKAHNSLPRGVLKKKRVSLVIGGDIVAPSDIVRSSSFEYENAGLLSSTPLSGLHLRSNAINIREDAFASSGSSASNSNNNSINNNNSNSNSNSNNNDNSNPNPNKQGSGLLSYSADPYNFKGFKMDLPSPRDQAEHREYVPSQAYDSPFAMDEDPLATAGMQIGRDDDSVLSDPALDDDPQMELTSAELDYLSSSPTQEIPRRQLPVRHAFPTFALPMTAPVPQPAGAGFARSMARDDPRGVPEDSTMPMHEDNDMVLSGSFRQSRPGSLASFHSESLGVSLIQMQLQSLRRNSVLSDNANRL